jgi:hypothetical protein
MNPWSGDILLARNTKPMRSRVVSKTMLHITKAILIFWIRVTSKNTTANASKRF